MGDFKIVSMKGLKFKSANGGTAEIMGGYGLYEINHGFVSFKGANEQNGVKTPYTNKRKVLQEIIDAGGLADFSQVEWLQAIN